MRHLLASLLLATAPQSAEDLIERLKPGEAFWAPQLAPEGSLTVVVSFPIQRAYVYRNGVPEIARNAGSPLATPTDGHAEPTSGTAFIAPAW